MKPPETVDDVATSSIPSSASEVTVTEEAPREEVPHLLPVRERAYEFYSVTSASSSSTAPLVLDCGSGNCKVGYANASLPSHCFPSFIGRPKYADVLDSSSSTSTSSGMEDCRMEGVKDYYVGAEAQAMRGVVSLEYPIRRGIVTDWDMMEKLWEYSLYTALDIGREESLPPVLLAEAPLTSEKDREQCTQIMFETFNASALCLKVQAALSLFSLGLTTGCVLESGTAHPNCGQEWSRVTGSTGDGVTHAVPVVEGYTVNSAIHRLDLAGTDVTAELRRLLRQRGYALYSSTAEFELVRDIKEKLAYVSVECDGDGGSEISA